MFAILVSWIIIAFVFFTFGRILTSIYSSFITTKGNYSFLDTFLLGLCTTGAIITLCSIFVPANIYLLGSLLAFSCLYWYFLRTELYRVYFSLISRIKGVKPLHIGIVIVAMLAIALYATGAPLWVDSPFYHFQNIMWNEQYHVVTGLANLEPRIGFNNNYFLLCSTFGLKPIFGQYIFGVHTLALALILGWTVYRSLKSTNLAQGFIPLLLMFAFIFGYKMHISSPSTDFLPNLLISYLILKLMFDFDALDTSPLLYFCLPVYCVTLKLSAFIICLFAIYIFVLSIKSKQYRSLLFLTLFGLLVAVPWCTRTVLLSGYLIFPFPSIDLFDFDWKIPYDYAREQEIVVYAFARVDSLKMDDALALPIWQWAPMWWQSGMFYYTPLVCRIIFIFSLLAMPLGGAMFFIDKAKRSQFSGLYLMWFIGLVGYIFWFTSAPDFRFGYGFIFAVTFIPYFFLVVYLGKKIEMDRKKMQSIQLFGCIIVILFISLQSFRWAYYKRLDTRPVYYTFLYKPQTLAYTLDLKEKHYKEKLRFVPKDVNGVQIYHATFESHCYECQLPCSSNYTAGIEMRGQRLEDGFRTKSGSPFMRRY